MGPISTIAGQILLAVGTLAVYIVSIAIYRLYFSSLAVFLGPKIAGIWRALLITRMRFDVLTRSLAATSLYQFYFDVIRGGEYIWKVEEMHKIYGELI